ncbi:fimbrial protein (plasmid) [Providencia rettgeri]|uniref:Fimbrial protein n=4 Tax=Providencia TaxID=586 RepID=A0AAJ6FX27_PRORE|nr:fimbrial protein [Providencia rettgeri]WHT81640.1 fimbrial protein [Providencia rettgeri]WHT95740.1 fimbrial protein [Providencia rettgeri]WJM88390.1 fimbrial protein [Providencia rettgeri]
MFLKVTRCSMFFAGLLTVQACAWAAAPVSTLSLQAIIANKGLGCDLIVPTSVLQFKPLQSSQLTGAIQTYQIQPLRVQLRCVDEHAAILPTLTIEGETPYAADIEQTVFLNGTPNGVGFMVRQSPGDTPISLAAFYQPTEAIGHGGKGTPLAVLDEDNLYTHEQILWVGLVGPFQEDIVAGHFQASLTLNVAFE